MFVVYATLSVVGCIAAQTDKENPSLDFLRRLWLPISWPSHQSTV
jgi:hypothetical protein